MATGPSNDMEQAQASFKGNEEIGWDQEQNDWQIRLLNLIKAKLNRVEHHVDNNRRKIRGVQMTLDKLYRIRNHPNGQNGNFSNEEIQRLADLSRKTLLRFNALVQGLADGTQAFVEVRRKIAFLEERVNRDANPAGSEDEERKRVMAMALECMQRADEILDQMSAVEEETRRDQGQQ